MPLWLNIQDGSGDCLYYKGFFPLKICPAVFADLLIWYRQFPCLICHGYCIVFLKQRPSECHCIYLNVLVHVFTL